MADTATTNDAQSKAIAGVWQRTRPQTRERLATLRRAADELTTSRTLDPALQVECFDIAHKLAGSLGMFGFMDATGCARAIEQTLSHPGLPQPERFDEQVTALASSLTAALADE